MTKKKNTHGGSRPGNHAPKKQNHASNRGDGHRAVSDAVDMTPKTGRTDTWDRIGHGRKRANLDPQE